MTPEGKIKARVDEVLKLWKAYKHKPVQNGMGTPALDYHVGHRGYYAAIETKARGKPPTVRQIRTMREVVAAGNSVFLIDHVDGMDMSELRGWLAYPTQRSISSTADRWLKEDNNESLDD